MTTRSVGAAVALTVATTFTVTNSQAADISMAVRTSSVAIQLAATTLGVGGTFDGYGATLPLSLLGTVVPNGDTYQPVPYPGIIFLDIPVISELPDISDQPYWPQTLGRSVGKGAAFLADALAKTDHTEKTTIVGYSQGAMVAETVRAGMAQDSEYTADAGNYEFVLLGNPYLPVGGIATRFQFLEDSVVDAVLNVPGHRPGPADSPFTTTNYSNEYDPISDFPAYFNPLAILNAVVGLVFSHFVPGYFAEDPTNPRRVETTVGNTTYVLTPQYLPLLAPFRAAAALIGAQRFVDCFEPVLRVLVEIAYDRTADPATVQPFSIITPQRNIDVALQQLPGAVAEGLAVLAGKPYVPPLPAAPIVSATPAVAAATADRSAAVDVRGIGRTAAETDQPSASALGHQGRESGLGPRAGHRRQAEQAGPSATRAR